MSNEINLYFDHAEELIAFICVISQILVLQHILKFSNRTQALRQEITKCTTNSLPSCLGVYCLSVMSINGQFNEKLVTR